MPLSASARPPCLWSVSTPRCLLLRQLMLRGSPLSWYKVSVSLEQAQSSNHPALSAVSRRPPPCGSWPASASPAVWVSTGRPSSPRSSSSSFWPSSARWTPNSWAKKITTRNKFNNTFFAEVAQW
jgi:hypothetical protein